MIRTPQWNPRQRRGTYLLILAAVLAVVTFASVRSYVVQVRSQVGPMQVVLRMHSDVRAYEPVVQVDEVSIPRRWVANGTLTDVRQLRGLVAAADLRGGSLLQAEMLVPPPAVGPDQRAVTITLSADTVPADVDRGGLIDVLAAFGTRNVPNSPQRTKVAVNDAFVVARQSLTGGGQDRVRLTMALSVKDALALSYAQSFGTDLRVVLVGHRSSPVPATDATYGGR